MSSGISALTQQNMYPMAGMNAARYSNSNQQPTGAVRFDGTDGSQVTDNTAPQDPTFGNSDLTALANNGVDPAVLQQLNSLKASNPTQYYNQLLSQLGANLNQNFQTNQNYDALLNQIQSLKNVDPQAYYNTMANYYGQQIGWEAGQNTSQNAAGAQTNLNNLLASAKAAGIDPTELSAIANQSNTAANQQNQQRIASQANSGGMFSGLGSLLEVAAPIALSAVLGPEVLAAMPELGAVGAGALTGGAIGGIGAGITGQDIGKGVLMGGATGALGGSLSGIDPSVAQGIKGLQTANNLYNATQSGGQNLGADINAAKGISTLTAAHGGLMAGGGGISSLGSYSDGGHLLKGPGDGMSDNIPASISGKQPARLADGEFVIPADVVSHLGNGSTDAGAKQLYAMMDRIRKARTGNPKQGKQINPNKFLPKG